MYDRSVAYWRGRMPSYFYSTSDGAAPPPNPQPNCNPQPFCEWYNQTTFDARVNGVCQETCRDLGHMQMGFAAFANGAATATLVGHWPFFSVYNSLNASLPQYDRNTELSSYLMRNAVIGFCASATSDTVSNSVRVLKTTKQASATMISYRQAANMVIEKDGVSGLFFRGLKTKILANGVQGMLFSVLWRLGQDMLNGRN